MRTIAAIFGVLLLIGGHTIRAQVPAGFSWINLETNEALKGKVRAALHDPTITALREIGVEGKYALVITASRESSAPTPDFDNLTVYSVTLGSTQARVLLRGYGLKAISWIHDELAVTYYTCWECEPTTLFTTLRLDPASGWLARWSQGSPSEGAWPQPGAIVALGGVGAPYDDDQVSQVFAVVSEPEGSFAAGDWFHARSSKSGKVRDQVDRFSTDPATGEDRFERLHGKAALKWERKICRPSDILINPAIGQDSAACRHILHAAASRSAAAK